MIRVEKIELPAIFLSISIIIYGALSSPTPDSLGVVEVVIGCLLVSAVLVQFLVGKKKRYLASEVVYFFVLVAFLLFGLVLAENNDIHQVFRDVVAHLFFCVPIIFFSRVTAKDIDRISLAASISGVLLALRFALESGFNVYEMTHLSFTFDGLLKLNTEPLLVFAEIYSVYKVVNSSGYLRKLLWVVVFSVPFIVLISSNMRGPVGIGVVSIVVALYHLNNGVSKRRIAVILVRVAIAVLLVASILHAYEIGILHGLIAKMEKVGASNKTREFMFLVSNIPDDIKFLVFGLGAGAWFDVGDAVFPFSHNMHMYYLYKSGIVVMGLVAMLTLFSIVEWIKSRGYMDYHLTLLMLLLLYGHFINPMYKYFGFGVCMLIFYSLMSFKIKQKIDIK